MLFGLGRLDRDTIRPDRQCDQTLTGTNNHCLHAGDDFRDRCRHARGEQTDDQQNNKKGAYECRTDSVYLQYVLRMYTRHHLCEPVILGKAVGRPFPDPGPRAFPVGHVGLGAGLAAAHGP